MNKKHILIAALVLALIASHGLVWWLTSRAHSPEQLAVQVGPPQPSLIPVAVTKGPVERTVLADCRPEARHVIAPDLSTAAGADNRPVVTGLPVKAGASMGNSDILTEVSSGPVIMLEGSLPAFRTLSVGVRGADVEQLHVALDKLDLYSGTHKAEYSTATAVHMREDGESYVDRRRQGRDEQIAVEVVFEADGQAAVAAQAPPDPKDYGNPSPRTPRSWSRSLPSSRSESLTRCSCLL